MSRWCEPTLPRDDARPLCDSGPENAKWFRTWWAGPRYASYVAQSEELDPAIARVEKDSNNSASRVRLAYLLEAKGDKGAAEEIWKKVEADALPPL